MWVTVEEGRVLLHGEICQNLGHIVDAEGLHTVPDKIKAIEQAPRSTNFQAFLGLIKYYGYILPVLSTVQHICFANY